MSAEGIEPSTNGLKGRCSAIELRAPLEGGLHSIMAGNGRQRNVINEDMVSSMHAEATMSSVKYVTEQDFQEEVISAQTPVLVDFTADWCQPCKMIAPIVEQLAGQWDGKVKVVKLDTDQNPGIMMQYGVMGIPTLMLFKSGEVKERITGYMPKDKIVAKVTPHV